MKKEHGSYEREEKRTFLLEGKKNISYFTFGRKAREKKVFFFKKNNKETEINGRKKREN